MSAPRFNYPTHPLFRIAPMLPKSMYRVDHDEYTGYLVGRIRAGRYTRDLWDSNSLYADWRDRHDLHAWSHPVAIKSRHQMTMAEIREFRRNDPDWVAKREKTAKQKEMARQYEAELARTRAEYAAEKARKAAEKDRRDREWEASAPFREEQRLILAGPWHCTTCGVLSSITPDGTRYRLDCAPCQRAVYGPHEILARLVLDRARKAA
jgi:hypothetical protein